MEDGEHDLRGNGKEASLPVFGRLQVVSPLFCCVGCDCRCGSFIVVVVVFLHRLTEVYQLESRSLATDRPQIVHSKPCTEGVYQPLIGDVFFLFFFSIFTKF